MEYKYKTIEEIKQLPKYKEFIEKMTEACAETTQKNIHKTYPLYEWYIEQCIQCEEVFMEFEKEFTSDLVSADDIADGVKNYFEVKEGK